MEGGVGPVAGSSHHSMAQRMPGIKVLSPMTPKEYQLAYDSYMEDDDPYYISEHRKSYDNNKELQDQECFLNNADFSIFPISITRLEMDKLKLLKTSKYGGLVTDDDHVEGTASSIANELSVASGKVVRTLGLKPKTAGFHPTVDNLPPTAEEIIKYLKNIKYGI